MDIVKCCNCEIALNAKHDIFINCDDCRKAGTDVVLCIQCFRMRAECGPHTRNHLCTVVGCKGAPFFLSKYERPWGWKEDLSLIKAAHKHRLGNWFEIKATMNSDRSADEIKNHFDRYFVRGALGRYALDNCRWPYIDDMTLDSSRSQLFRSDIGGAPDTCQWKYISKYFENFDGSSINFNDPKWFQQFEADLQQIKNESFSPPVLSPIKCEVSKSPEKCISPSVLPFMSPVAIEFQRNTERWNSLLSSSDFDESGDEVCSSAESCNNCMDDSSSISRRPSRFQNIKGESQNFHSLVKQCSDDESDFNDIEKRKPILRLKRIGKRCKKARKPIPKDFLNGPVVKIDVNDQERLRQAYPEQFFVSKASVSINVEERSKLKDDDLQLLAFTPEREDFEWEFNNDMEKLISRLTLKTNADNDDDTSFENAVKIAKLQKYNRTLKQRKAKKAVIREYDIVSKFFGKVKKIDNHSQNQKHTLSLLSKTYQVAEHAELQQLSDALIEFENLRNRIVKLKKLKARGVRELKGQKELNTERIRPKRKKRALRLNDSHRRANLRWVRFKRWRINHAQEAATIDSDV